MSDIVVCIPSYKRSKIISSKTLKCLEGIDPSIIKIFVVEDEYELYKEDTQGKYEIIVGVKGLIKQREFIENYYPTGTHIVFLDDDISSIDLSIQYPNLTLEEFFKKAFEELKTRDAYIWSVYPVYNPFFRKTKKEITECLNVCIGAFYGIINRPNDHDLKLKVSIDYNDNKEDVERSILYFKKDGKTIRFNQVGFQTKYYGKVGGMGTLEERMTDIIGATKRMNETYPEYGTIKIRKNGIHEFKLNLLNPFSIQDKCVKVLPSVSQIECDNIYNALQSITIPFKNNRNSRYNFGKHRSSIFGIVRKKFTGKVELSAMSVKYPSLYEKLMSFGKIVCGDFEFTSIQINHNVTSPKHIDKGNSGKSILVSVGEYSGSNIGIYVEEEKIEYHNTQGTPVMFCGGILSHFNTPDLIGNKYSLIFYNHSWMN